MDELRECCRCHQYLPVSEFYLRRERFNPEKRVPYGHCKRCHGKASKGPRGHRTDRPEGAKSMVRMAFCLSPEEAEALRAAAHEASVSVSSIVRDALRLSVIKGEVPHG